ncbi:AraC family transcriptional regulator [Myxococcus stipitatus DSM 14675]|uniref:AraC family transcriptional regulator n=1 Tax=Myxococcus stipitatus (strain DSM 14675 / JCM 12634 / Mx s8) TaxID=1278073 RepID=L7U7Q2_MYXSD|nr:AraC family transcriptional regulator [Myxococcus stipitatus]AGC43850.1 AraC family transcriptional regulator [Myxococcus stipitatus DSM 14675]
MTSSRRVSPRARPARPGLWGGRLFFGPQRLMYAGPLAPTEPHAHPTFQVMVALGEPVRMRDGDSHEADCPWAVIPPDVEHTVVRGALDVVLLHVPAEGLAGRRLRMLGVGARAEDWLRAGEWLRTCGVARLPVRWAEAEAWTRALLSALQAEVGAPPPTHPAVKKLLRLLPESLDGDVRLSALAPQVGLSVGRLSHLFRAEAGFALRPYILWLRLQRAAEHLQRGASLTEAAHAAGFTDSAHLNHSFRRTLGLNPSEIAGVVQWVGPPSG